jgi:protein TonB
MAGRSASGPTSLDEIVSPRAKSKFSDQAEQPFFHRCLYAQKPASLPLPGELKRRSNMLEDSLFESQGRRKARKPLMVAASAIAHMVTIVVLVLIPLIQTQAITIPAIDTSLLAPRIEAPKSVEVFAVQPRIQKYTQSDPNILTAPESIPERITYVDEPTSPSVGLLPSPGTNGLVALLNDLINPGTETAAPAVPVPPPPPPPSVVKTEPIRQGGNVQAANLIHQVNPVYPPLARQARVQGVVVLEAVISREGSIESLRVVTGHPLLNQAALDAVKQWKYRPTMLNGDAVEVITTVTVTFTLQ